MTGQSDAISIPKNSKADNFFEDETLITGKTEDNDFPVILDDDDQEPVKFI